MMQHQYIIMVDSGNENLTHVTTKIGHGDLIDKTIHEFLVDQILTQMTQPKLRKNYNPDDSAKTQTQPRGEINSN